MLRRLPFIICLFVAFDFLLLGTLTYWLGWKPAVVGNGVTTVIGLVVILYYEWRWSEAVARRIESEPSALDSWCLEKILLLVAGIVLLIPGVMTDVLGLLVLIPSVRRLIVAHSRGVHEPLKNSL